MLASPEYIIAQFNLPAHAHIADIGAGTGHYALALARKLEKNKGKLFAIDVQKELLEKLAHDAEHEGLTDVHTIWGNAEKKHGTKLRDESIDGVIIANTFFQIDHKEDFLKEVVRILKKDGHFYIVEWSDSFNGMGPQPQYLIDPEDMKKLCTEAGLSYEKDLDAGEHHYGMVFYKQ